MSQACDGEHLQIQLCVGPMSVICGMTFNLTTCQSSMSNIHSSNGHCQDYVLAVSVTNILSQVIALGPSLIINTYKPSWTQCQ